MENSTKEKEKEKWYPGKYLARHSSKRRSGEVPSRISSDNSDQRKTTSSVFPMENQEFVQEPVVGEVHLGSSPIGINSIGSVKVGVVDLKYLRINSAKLTIQLDRALSQYAIDSSAKYFERIFELFEISTDVRIMVTGKGDNGELVCGVAVIPVASLLTFTGKPAPAKEQWRLLYPICVSRIADSKSFKFTAGYSDLAGYALNRCKDPLGFICVKVDLALTGNILSTYLAKGSIGWRKALTSAPWVDCVSLD